MEDKSFSNQHSHPINAPAYPEPTCFDSDGRCGWDGIFNYVWSSEIDEFCSPYPPKDNKWPYRIEVNPGCLEAFGKIVSSGIIYDKWHTGRDAVVNESPERRTTQ